MTAITYGSVCSGIEAASVAWEPLGWKPLWFSEIEPFPSAVLQHHWPEVPNLGDFTKIRDRIESGEIEAPDVLVGGTPCQAFSVAGLRKSLDDYRGQLSLEFVRLADAIDHVRSVRGRGPCTVVWENVPGVLNTSDNAFGCFLAGLAGEDVPLEPPGGKWANAGYVCGPQRAIAFRILDAQYFGVAQRRRRVFVVASAGAVRPEQVLFEFDGVRRDSPSSREAGQGASADVAPRIGASGRGFERTGETRGQDPVAAVPQAFDILGVPATRGAVETDVHTPLRARTPGQSEASTTTVVAVPEVASTLRSGSTSPASHGKLNGTDRMSLIVQCATGDIAHTLRAEGFDASEDGTGRGAGAIAVGFNARQDPDSWEGRTGPLDTDGGTQAVAMLPVPLKAAGACGSNGAGIGVPGDPCPTLDTTGAQAVAFSSKDYGADASEGLAPTMRSMGHNESHANGGGQLAVAFQEAQTGVREYDTAGTLRSEGPGHDPVGTRVRDGMQVRRLTVTEAERLQGFPDGHTLIPWRGKSAAECPDGPRYKALGNSMAVPVMRWIGRRLSHHLRKPQ